MGTAGEAAAGQFGEAIEVQQLALREQHHQRANGVIQQHGLYFARGVQAVVVQHFFVGNPQFAQQQPNNRRSVQGFWGEGSFSHGLYPYSNNRRSITSLFKSIVHKLRRCSHLAVLLPMAQPAVEQRADVVRPALQQCLGGVAHGGQ